MNSTSSAFIGSGGQFGAAAARASCHQMSLSVQAMSCSVRRTTSTFSIVGHIATASSAMSLSGMICPRRHAPSPVMTSLQEASWMRSARADAAKPPKTTEWIAPMRAQASIEIGSSGTMPR